MDLLVLFQREPAAQRKSVSAKLICTDLTLKQCDRHKLWLNDIQISTYKLFLGI